MPAAAVAGFGVQQIILGGAIITGDAFVAGATPEISDPADEPINGWMWKLSGAVAAQPTEEETRVTRFIGDFRSQRKLTSDTELYLAGVNLAITGTAFTVQLAGIIRVLVKLP